MAAYSTVSKPKARYRNYLTNIKFNLAALYVRRGDKVIGVTSLNFEHSIDFL